MKKIKPLSYMKSITLMTIGSFTQLGLTLVLLFVPEIGSLPLLLQEVLFFLYVFFAYSPWVLTAPTSYDKEAFLRSNRILFLAFTLTLLGAGLLSMVYLWTQASLLENLLRVLIYTPLITYYLFVGHRCYFQRRTVEVI